MENWKEVKGFEKGYLVSDKGRLKSTSRIVDYGLRKAKRPSKILSLRKGKLGYFYTVLSIDSKRKTVKIHRLVAIAFIPNPENKPQVNHIDGDKSNNNVSNLEWSTAKENTQHAYKIGLKKGIKGELSHLSKLTKKEVIDIIKLYSSNRYSQKELGNIYKVSQSQIHRIVKRVNW